MHTQLPVSPHQTLFPLNYINWFWFSDRYAYSISFTPSLWTESRFYKMILAGQTCPNVILTNCCCLVAASNSLHLLDCSQAHLSMDFPDKHTELSSHSFPRDLPNHGPDPYLLHCTLSQLSYLGSPFGLINHSKSLLRYGENILLFW